jgi:hypothetical protein
VNDSTTISKQGLGPIFWGIKDLVRSDILITYNSQRKKMKKNATCWTCPNQTTTFHLRVVKGKDLRWVLMA